MKIVLATLAQPTYTSELYDWALRDLADLFETKAFATQDEAMAWAIGEIMERNEELAKENVDIANDYPDLLDSMHKLYEQWNDRVEDDGTRVVLWTEGGTEDGTPDNSYCLVMREAEVG